MRSAADPCVWCRTRAIQQHRRDRRCHTAIQQHAAFSSAASIIRPSATATAAHAQVAHLHDAVDHLWHGRAPSANVIERRRNARQGGALARSRPCTNLALRLSAQSHVVAGEAGDGAAPAQQPRGDEAVAPRMVQAPVVAARARHTTTRLLGHSKGAAWGPRLTAAPCTAPERAPLHMHPGPQLRRWLRPHPPPPLTR